MVYGIRVMAQNAQTPAATTGYRRPAIAVLKETDRSPLRAIKQLLRRRTSRLEGVGLPMYFGGRL